MTVALVDNKREYVGLSTDTKPTAAKAGSTFVETDTGDVFVADSASAWTVLRVADRGNTEGTALALEADTIATRQSADITNPTGKRLQVAFVTGNKIGTTATYEVSLEWKYDGTNYVTLWTAAATVTNNGTVLYDLGPGVADVGDGLEAVELLVPKTFRLVVTVGGTANASHNMDTSVFYGLGG